MDVSNGPTPTSPMGAAAAALGQSLRQGLMQLQEQQQQLPPGRYPPASASPSRELSTGSRLGFDEDVGMSLASTPAAVRMGPTAAGPGGGASGLDPVAVEGVMQQLRVRAGQEEGRGGQLSPLAAMPAPLGPSPHFPHLCESGAQGVGR